MAEADQDLKLEEIPTLKRGELQHHLRRLSIQFDDRSNTDRLRTILSQALQRQTRTASEAGDDVEDAQPPPPPRGNHLANAEDGVLTRMLAILEGQLAAQQQETRELRARIHEQQPRREEGSAAKAITRPELLDNSISYKGFRQWRASWNNYAQLSKLSKSSPQDQLATFRTVCKPDFLDTLTYSVRVPENTDRGLNDIFDEIETFLKSKSSIAVDRHHLVTSKQDPGESPYDFHVRLMNKAKDADIRSMTPEDWVATVMISGTCHDDARQELLAMKPTPDLDTVISVMHSKWLASNEARRLHGSSINRVGSKKKFNGGKRSRPPFKRDNNKKPTEKECWNCGGKWPHTAENKCKATGKTCFICGKTGHFSKKCKKKANDSNKSRTFKQSALFKSRINGVQHGHPTLKVNCHHISKGFMGSVEVVPDTGAQKSVSGLGLLDKLGLKTPEVKRCSSKLESVNGQEIDTFGHIDIELELEGSRHREQVILCRDVGRQDFYLSLDACKALKIVHKSFPYPIGSIGSVSQGGPEADKAKLVNEYVQIFDQGGSLPTMKGEPMKIELLPNAKPYCMSGVRPVPYSVREETMQEIKRMEEQGIIEPIGDEPCEWCHPMVVVSKPKGGVRITVDLTQLNSQVKRPIHPAKTPFDAVNEVAKGAQYFTVCDAAKGYWQVELEEESRPLTTFYTPWGRFRFRRAPMGFISTGDSYNWRGDKAIEGLVRTHKVVDDVLIASRSYEEHIQDVRNFFEVCKENQITLSKHKLQFAQTRAVFAGYVVSREGIESDPNKVRAISQFPEPENITQLRSFMGLVNQLGAFSSEISSAAHPLRELLKKRNDFVWLNSHQKAFDQVKECLSKPPVLANFDPSKETRLETDASRLNGLGFMLLQNHDGQWKLVLCGSRFLADVETRYSMIELEALAIKYAMKKCHLYLYGLPKFEVVTDHRPLLPIFNSYHLSQVENAKIQGIKSSLQSRYQFTLTWRASKDHAIADCLSRAPVDDPSTDDVDQVRSINAILKGVYESNEAQGDIKTEEMISVASIDPDYQALIKEIKKDFKNLSKAPAFVQQFKAISHELSTENGLIFFGDRLVVPQAKRKEVLQSLHAAHLGITRTKQRARLAVYWPGITNDIVQMIERCNECQTHQASQGKEPQSEDAKPTRPFECVSTDLFSLNGRSYLICADRYSGYVYVKEFEPDPSSKEVTIALLEMWQHSGYPISVRSDNGPQFNSHVFRKFLARKGVKWNPSTPHFPSSNGHAEANVKKVKTALIKLGCSSEDERFIEAIMEIRNTPNDSGFSPNQIVFGDNIRTMVPFFPNYAKKWRDRAEEIDSQKAKLSEKAQTYYNRGAHTLKPLKLGARVRIQNTTNKRWDRIGDIIAIGKNRDYHVKLPSGRVFWRNRRFLREYHFSEETPSDARPPPSSRETTPTTSRSPPRPREATPSTCESMVTQAQTPRPKIFRRSERIKKRTEVTHMVADGTRPESSGGHLAYMMQSS